MRIETQETPPAGEYLFIFISIAHLIIQSIFSHVKVNLFFFNFHNFILFQKFETKQTINFFHTA